MKMDKQQGPLERAIDQQSAEWLEATYPVVFDALLQEMDQGKSLEEIKRILRRKFGTDLREPFVVRILQTAEYFRYEQADVAR